MKLTGFDAERIEPQSAFKPLPTGTYTAVISASEERKTQSGNGSYLRLTLQIVDGEHKGRQLFENLNLDNPNPQAVEIAQQTLSSICHAVGVMQPDDSADLHDKPLTITVITRKRKDTGEDANAIKGFDSASNEPAQATWTAAKGAPFDR